MAEVYCLGKFDAVVTLFGVHGKPSYSNIKSKIVLFDWITK